MTNAAISEMLRKYDTSSPEGVENALKEISQNIILCGLSRTDFFTKAAFYGETALRILFGLDRFSEDIDFCLKDPDESFSFEPYFAAIERELKAFGFTATFHVKDKKKNSKISSAFVKQDTFNSFIAIGIHKGAQKGKTLKIKLEVDKTNPKGAEYELKIVKEPTIFSIQTLTEGSLFSGKLHAVIARSYVNRVKGRDFYDLLFYISRSTAPSLPYLEAKLYDSGHINEPLTAAKLKEILLTKIEATDFKKAKEDVVRFLGKDGSYKVDQ